MTYIDRTYHINSEGCFTYKAVGFSKQYKSFKKPVGFSKACRIFQKAVGFSKGRRIFQKKL
jgi:hypothetical protein